MRSVASESSRKPNRDWRKEMAELQGAIARMQRAIEMFIANYVRQGDQVPQEVAGNLVVIIIDPVPHLMAQDICSHVNGQLLKDFMAL